MQPVLILYYSRHGATRALANKIALGVESAGVPAMLRTVPPVSDNLSQDQDQVPPEGDPYVEHRELESCSGLALGSPTRFGNMAAAMKYFWDSTSSQWLSGVLNGKPASVFTATSSLHGGQETTLLTMMLPLIHHGMTVMGIPYSAPQLHSTRTGGTPYGSSHVSFGQHAQALSEDEAALAIYQGERLAKLAIALENQHGI